MCVHKKAVFVVKKQYWHWHISLYFFAITKKIIYVFEHELFLYPVDLVHIIAISFLHRAKKNTHLCSITKFWNIENDFCANLNANVKLLKIFPCVILNKCANPDSNPRVYTITRTLSAMNRSIMERERINEMEKCWDSSKIWICVSMCVCHLCWQIILISLKNWKLNWEF